MRSFGCALVQYDWYPSRKKKLGHICTPREDHLKTQGEKTAKERGLRKNQPC